MEAKETSTALSTNVVPCEPITVKVGDRYEFLLNQVITSCKVEKIYQDVNGETYLVLTVDIPQDKFTWDKKTQTSTITLSEFKLRLIKGGISEIVI